MSTEQDTPAWFGVAVAIGCLLLVGLVLLVAFGGVWITTGPPPP